MSATEDHPAHPVTKTENDVHVADEPLTEPLGDSEKPKHSDEVVSSSESANADAPEKKDDKPQRSKGKLALIMLALGMAVFLAALDVTIVTTALPTISEEFDSIAGYTWVGSAFLLANAASIPSWGKVSDIFGRKPMLLVANIIFMVGSLIAALSYSIGMLIAARAIQGLGAGGLIILVNICIGDLFSLRIRGAFYGIIGGVWAVASAIGPIIGGAFTQNVTWRWCFYINLPLDGIAFFILLFFLDLKTPKTPLMEGIKAIDWVGSFLVVTATLLFLFGLQYGGVTFPWDSAIVLCLLIIGVFTFVLFILWEWRFPKYPIMPLGLFTKRTNIATLGVVFFHGIVFISGSYYLPLYFQASLGATPILSGVYLLPTCLALSVGSLGSGVLIAKTGMFLPPILFGLSMMTLGAGLFINLAANSSWAKIILYQIVIGLGIGPLFQAPIIALQAHINPRDVGTATATLGFIRQLATTTGVVIGQVVFQNQMAKKYGSLEAAVGPQLANTLAGGAAGAETEIINQLPDAAKSVVQTDVADSLSTMWIMFTCLAAAGLICGLFIQRRKLTREHEETVTGLEAEKKHAADRKAEKDAKRQSRISNKGRPGSGAGSSEEVPALPTEQSTATAPDLEKGQA